MRANHTVKTVDNNTLCVSGPCVQCGKMISVNVPFTGWKAWEAGDFIQEALPTLSAGEREFLISGACEPCFDRLFAE